MRGHAPMAAQARAIVIVRHIEGPEAALGACVQSSIHPGRASIRCARTGVGLPDRAGDLAELRAHGQLAWRVHVVMLQLCSLAYGMVWRNWCMR